MKHNFFSVLILFIVLLSCHVTTHAKFNINGPQTHFILADDSSTLNFNTDVEAFCKNLIIKKIVKEIVADAYGYDDAGTLLCNLIGPGNINIAANTNLEYDLWLSKHSLLNIDATSNLIIDGLTHFIHSAREATEPAGLDELIIITNGGEVTFKNVVLKTF